MLGIAELASRRIPSLGSDEARAVALCEALTSNARLVLLDEPYAIVDPRAASHLATAVRRRAAEGACVLVATASVREASEVADVPLVLERGALVRRSPSLAQLVSPGAGKARLRATSGGARALLAALATEPNAASFEADARSVVVSGTDPLEVARAVARAAVRAGVQIESLRAEVPRVEELRASLKGRA
jgi:ABC-type multidrug transport system ATPase subunit